MSTEAQKEKAKKHYRKNKERLVKLAMIRNAGYRKRNQEYVNKIKVEKGCYICGYNKCPEALDFHHKDDNKESGIADLRKQGYAVAKIQEEIEKCIVICANCHRELHATET